MFLAAATLIGLAAPTVWRCYDEVYDLSVYQGRVVAATSGGALVEGADRLWRRLGSGCPAPLRELIVENGALEGVDRTGDVYALRDYDGGWASLGRRATPVGSSLPDPALVYRGTRVHAPWGGRFLVDGQGADVLARDPADGDYALLEVGGRLLAGTPRGVYAFESGAWKAETVPSELPVLRPMGIAFAGSSTVVGGLTGVYIQGRSEAWSRVSKDAVRQFLASGGDVWVLYGSGGVDKLDVAHNQLVYDAVNQGAKRPWTSCLASFDGTILFGGQGGWIERSKHGVSEHYFPEIDQDVVMAAAGRGAVRWIGTQKTGLLRFGEGPVRQWNPGNGLADTWVTALLHAPEGLYVATSGDGLFLLRGDSIAAVESPTKRPRQLALYKGKVVVGGMDGAWILDTNGWRELATNGEETTALVAGTRLIVCTASGVYFF